VQQNFYIVINEVVTWLNKLDVKVRFENGCEDEYLGEKRLIKICPDQTPESQLHGLLHEAGHAIIASNQDVYSHYLSEPSADNSDINVLCEEVVAWEKGKELAEYLDIEIDDVPWMQHRNESIRNYVENILDFSRKN
jgi:hypothetical protein